MKTFILALALIAALSSAGSAATAPSTPANNASREVEMRILTYVKNTINGLKWLDDIGALPSDFAPIKIAKPGNSVAYNATREKLIRYIRSQVEYGSGAKANFPSPRPRMRMWLDIAQSLEEKLDKADLTLANGKIYRGIYVSGAQPDGLYIMTKNGQVKINYKDLSAKDRKRYAPTKWLNSLKAAKHRINITTKWGKTYKNVRVISVHPTGIHIENDRGIIPIDKSDLTPSDQKKYYPASSKSR